MLNLIPKPQSCKEGNGTFTFGKNAAVYTEIELPLLNMPTGDDPALRIIKDDTLGREEYSLKVDGDGVLIKASCANGAYYALQSVRMLGRFDEGKNEIPFVEIFDRPQYGWRGVSLDEARHFFGKTYVKKLIGEMFRLKLNVLHWHLSDDSGWRIEIKKYPLLTEVGSKRAYTQIDGWSTDHIDGKPHSGFYTQEDIKEIVAYAAQRCVSIIPEIDVPAHFAAGLAAYPQMACRNLQRDVMGFFGDKIPFAKGMKDWNRPLCMGKEEVFGFITDIYDEICELFPFEYFHIGGDECDVTEWKTCPDCQRVMKEKGFKNERQLQLMLTDRLCKYFKEKGKSVVGWNEILREDGIDKSAVAQYWEQKRDRKVERHVNSGGRIIMSNHQSFYFDHPYSIRTLKATYSFSPYRYGVNKANIGNVLGIEAEMWTEWIATEEKLDFMYHPRMEALSEVAWTDEKHRNFKDFVARLDSYKSIYKALGINYAVDKISMPKNPLRSAKITKLFYNGDTDFELKQNEMLYEKGNR